MPETSAPTQAEAAALALANKKQRLENEALTYRGLFDTINKDLVTTCTDMMSTTSQASINYLESISASLDDYAKNYIQAKIQLVGVDGGNAKTHNQESRSMNETAKASRQSIMNAIRKVESNLQKKAEDDAKAAAAAAAAAAKSPASAPSTGSEGNVRLQGTASPTKLKNTDSPGTLATFKRLFQSYFALSKLNLAATVDQQNSLIMLLDQELQNHLLTTVDPDTPIFDDPNDPKVVSCFSILEDRFRESYPLLVRRLNFFLLKQQKDENFAAFNAKLKQARLDADIDKMQPNDHMIFRIITGISDNNIREKLLKLKAPTLEVVESTILAAESAKASLQAVSGKTTASASQVQSGNSGKSSSNKKNQKGNQKGNSGKSSGGNSNNPGVCKKCGRSSAHATCPAAKAVCINCKQVGHFWKGKGDVILCPNPKAKSSGGGTKTESASFVQCLPAKSCAQDYLLTETIAFKPQPAVANAVTYYVNDNPSRPTPKMSVTFAAQGQSVDFKAVPDTGATRTVVNWDIIEDLGLTLRSTDSQLIEASGRDLTVCGETVFKVSAGDMSAEVDALVVHGLYSNALISWHDLIELGVLHRSFPEPLPSAMILQVAEKDSKEKIIEDFPDVLMDKFHASTNKMTGSPMKIQLRDDIDVKPTRVNTARTVPVHLQKSANALIESLLQAGIIERVGPRATDWCSPAHFVEKPPTESRPEVDSRLVTDFTGLNRFVKRPVHPFYSPRDLMRQFPPDAKVFARFDALHGYFQVPLDEESKDLTVFLIAQGRFRYCVAPMGLNASGDEFCFRTDITIVDLDWIMKIVDDYLVHAPTYEILWKRVRLFLERMRSSGICLSLKKFAVGREMKFAGFVVSDEGLKPDPAKIAAIAKFPTPKDTTTLKSFLGLAQQLAMFLPDLSQCTVIMRELLRRGVAWNWTPEIDAEFVRAKSILAKAPVVQPFDPELPTVLLTDASALYGMGYALCQRNGQGHLQLVSCGSKSLSPAETRYAVIELECLAIKYGILDNEYYLRGMKEFVVYTDHRPLDGIFKKNLCDLSNARLLRFREALADYNFTVEWVEGKTHLIADALSRNPVFGPEDGDHEDPVAAVVLQCIATDPAFSDIFDHGLKDHFHSALADAIEKKQPAVAPHKSDWENMSVIRRDDDNAPLVVVDGRRILVPEGHRREILRRLHASHSGESKTLQNARKLYSWPGMKNQIIQMTRNCGPCQELRPSQPREPFRVDPMGATSPMEALGMDLFHCKSEFLLVVDRFSGFIWVRKLRNLDTDAIIRHLRGIFDEFGNPERIRTDGGPQFRGGFTEFCEKRFIIHEKSSPHNPNSNGLAESAVKNAKYLLMKTNESGEDYATALSEWRNTPRADGYSPAEAFFGRRPRGLLPALPQPEFDAKDFVEKRTRSKAKSLIRADKHTEPLQDLEPGDRVIVQDPLTKRWTLVATVTKVYAKGRSFDVETDEGVVYRRNRRFLRLLWADQVPEEPAIFQEHPSVSDQVPELPLRRSARLLAKKKAE